MDKYKVAILSNELELDHILWIKACEQNSEWLEYDVINLTKAQWYSEIISKKYDYYLAKPPGLTEIFKKLYDERISIIAHTLKLPLYPSSTEIYIYENKRFLSYWLQANNIPHPKTVIFYYRAEAESYIKKQSLPLVAKVNIGASGSGVKILRNNKEATEYISRSFERKGAPKRWGPNFKKGNLLMRGINYIIHPSLIEKKIHIYKSRMQEIQRGVVLFQEFIPHEYEWRVVRIGDSFFAHKKLKLGEKASGSTIKQYDNPPLSILDFVKALTDKYQLYSQAIDIFEDKNRGYLVNEMQCIFGQSDPYQMLVNGKTGRYRFLNKSWVFEEGDFNKNESYDLRVRWIIDLLKQKKNDL